MSKYIVTGGAGFLGRRVVDQLKEAGAHDVVVPRRADFDLTRQVVAEDLIAEVGPDIVIHLAAEVGGIGANQANPGRYFYANAAMGLNLIEASRRFGVGKFVQVGTVCSYPKHSDVPFSEDHLWDGFPEETNAPYGIAKRGLLMMLQAYSLQYGLNGIYLLPANLYGPGDNFDVETSHVIPALVRRFVDARRKRSPSVTLWGTGSPSREFLHVREAARGIVAAAFNYDDPEPMNLGTGVETTIGELAAIIADVAGYTGAIEWDTTRPDGQPRRSLNTGRAERALGFRASVSLEDGIRETVDWWEQQTT